MNSPLPVTMGRPGPPTDSPWLDGPARVVSVRKAVPSGVDDSLSPVVGCRLL